MAANSIAQSLAEFAAKRLIGWAAAANLGPGTRPERQYREPRESTGRAGHRVCRTRSEAGRAAGTIQIPVHDRARRQGRGVMFLPRQAAGSTAATPALPSLAASPEADGVISAESVMSRHNDDPEYVPMFDVDNIALSFTGTRRGEQIHFEGGSAALPGFRFKTVLTADQRRSTRRRPARSARTASATGSIRSTSGCSTASTAATAASWCCMTGASAAATRSSTTSAPTRRQRQMEGRTRQPRAYAGQGRAAAVRRP